MSRARSLTRLASISILPLVLSGIRIVWIGRCFRWGSCTDVVDGSDGDGAVRVDGELNVGDIGVDVAFVPLERDGDGCGVSPEEDLAGGAEAERDALQGLFGFCCGVVFMVHL